MRPGQAPRPTVRVVGLTWAVRAAARLGRKVRATVRLTTSSLRTVEPTRAIVGPPELVETIDQRRRVAAVAASP